MASFDELIHSIQKDGNDGKVLWDKTRPNGTHRKLLDTTKISSLGWKPKISLKDGIEDTYKWFINNIEKVKL